VFLLSLLIFLAPILPDSSEVQNRLETQVDTYISGIKEHNNGLYRWALYEAATSDCKSYKIIQKEFKTRYFNCEKLVNEGSISDSLRFLWSEQDRALLEKIISKDTILTENILSLSEKPHLHLELLMRRSFHKFYDQELLSKALEKWVHIANNNDSSNSLQQTLYVINIIWVAFINDDYRLLNKYADRFISADSFPISTKLLRIYSALDFSYYATQQFDKSLRLQREYSIPLASYLEENTLIQQIKKRQGVYLYSLGKYEESKNIYEELYAQSDGEDFYLLTNLSNNYYKLGYSNKYISFQLRALEFEFKDYRNLLNVYRNLFLYYTANKDISSALQYIEKAKEVAVNNNDSTELALIDSYLGTFYWTQYRDHKKALENFDAAQQVLSPSDNYIKYIDLLGEKGDVYFRIDSLSKAREIFKSAKDLALSKSNTVDYLDALINLAAIELKQNNMQAAEEIFDEINLYPLDDVDFPLLTKFFTVRSQFLSLQNNNRAAINELAPVVDQVIDRAKNNTDSQEGFWSVEDEYLDAVELLVEMLISNQNTSEALTLLDKLKTINDAALYNSPLVKAAKLSEEDLAEEKRLNQRIQSLRKRYLNAQENDRFTIKQEIDRISALREQILSEVNLNKSTPLSPVWAIQRSIDEDELVLHFTEVGSTLYITCLTHNHIEITPFEFSGDTKEHFSKIADALASGNTDLQALHEIYEQLNLDDIPKQIQKISVIPDNFLYRIPLEVLPSHQPDSPFSFGSTRYLIEDYQFRYFTSLKEFESNRRSSFSGSNADFDFSGFGISDFSKFNGIDLPSLPYATIETQNIQTTLSTFEEENKDIFTGDQATKETFKSRVGNSRLVHVATHSEVSEQDPLFSTIYLTTRNPADTALQSDQALYAYELFDTPLNSEFIMLNSCSSGSGNYIQGSGIMGISRALRYAGAQSLALNLWAVNDKIASEFATDFYTSINKGNSKNKAIREAKLNQLKTGNANPHFWGAYTMIGNPAPITPKDNYHSLFLILLALGTVMTGFMAYSSGKEV